jgi:hypothetical protein
LVKSTAVDVDQYLSEFPEDKKNILERVRDTVLKNLNAGFEETMNWGMISYEVPLIIYPNTYNKKPLQFAALASQKRHFSLYLMSVYQNPAFNDYLQKGFEDINKKPDMGKSCIRFKRVDDIPLKVIGEIIRKTTVEDFIKTYEGVRRK